MSPTITDDVFTLLHYAKQNERRKLAFEITAELNGEFADHYGTAI